MYVECVYVCIFLCVCRQTSTGFSVWSVCEAHLTFTAVAARNIKTLAIFTQIHIFSTFVQICRASRHFNVWTSPDCEQRLVWCKNKCCCVWMDWMLKEELRMVENERMTWADKTISSKPVWTFTVVRACCVHALGISAADASPVSTLIQIYTSKYIQHSILTIQNKVTPD